MNSLGIGLGLLINNLGVGKLKSSALSFYAIGGILPAVALDFERSYLSAPLALTRAGSATYLDQAGTIQTAAADVSRYDWTGGARALLVEASGTNLLTHAKAHTTTGWSLNGATGTNLALSALGIFSGVAVASAGVTGHRLQTTTSPTVTTGAAYHLRAFFAFGSAGKMLVTLRNLAGAVQSQIEFTPSSTTITATAAGTFGTTSLTDLGGGIHRLDLVFTPSFTGTLSIGFGPNSTSIGHTVIFLGAQFEPGTAASSLVISAGAATTRSADAPSISLPAGSYDVRIVLDTGQIDTLAVAHAGGAYWPAAAAGRVRQVLVYEGGTL